MTRIIVHADGQAPVTIELDGCNTQPLHLHLGPVVGHAEAGKTESVLAAPVAVPRRAWKKTLPALAAGGLAAIVIIGTRPALLAGPDNTDTATQDVPPQTTLLPPLPGVALSGGGTRGMSTTYIPGMPISGGGNAFDRLAGHTPGEQIEAARRAMTQRPVVAYPQPSGAAQTAPTAAVAPVAPAAPVTSTIDAEKSPFGLEN